MMAGSSTARATEVYQLGGKRPRDLGEHEPNFVVLNHAATGAAPVARTPTRGAKAATGDPALPQNQCDDGCHRFTWLGYCWFATAVLIRGALLVRFVCSNASKGRRRRAHRTFQGCVGLSRIT